MLHHWKAIDFEIIDSEYQDDPTSSCEIIPSRTLNLKHLEIIKVSDKPTYNEKLENS